jgi:hypothetical protein
MMISLVNISFFLTNVSGQSSAVNLPGSLNDQNNRVLTFNKVVSDSDGKKYLIGEVTNSDSKNHTIEAMVYFNKKADLESSYFSKYVGSINPGMGIPFKIPLQNSSSGQLNPDPADLKVNSRLVPSIMPIENQSDLSVDYSTLVMDSGTHSITGILDNKSPSDAYGVTVRALALDSQAKVLDVVESKIISSIPANSSAPFTLIPMKSIAHQVAVYSCYVRGQSGMNVTLPIENNQSVQFEMQSEGKIRNMVYNATTHSINFGAEGTLLRGGWLGMMFTDGPNSFVDGNFTVLLNGQNATKSLISSAELSPGKYYKHIETWFPFGKNTVSIVSTTTAPEFPTTPIVTISAISFVVLFGYILRKKNYFS